MKVVNMRSLEGPNVYLHRPVMLMRLDLEDLTGRESFEFPAAIDRLLYELPGLYEHYCGLGHVGGFVERLYGGTYFGHIVEHVAIELANRLGYKAHYGRTRNAGMPNLYDVVVETESPIIMEELLKISIDFVQSCVKSSSFDLSMRMNHAQQLQIAFDLGPSTKALLDAARRRKIPYRRIGHRSLVQLGTGKYRKLIQATLTSRSSAIAVDIASDKELTKMMLHQAGLYVPRGGATESLQGLWEWFKILQKPVVIKPLYGCQGQGVTLGVDSLNALEEAYYFAQRISKQVIIEEEIMGKQYRLLVVDGRLVAASERIPAHVVGDGVHTLRELVNRTNQEANRGEDHEKPLTKIKMDEFVLRFLQKSHLHLEMVPENGRIVYLRDSANISTGGIANDVTDQVHPVHAQAAIRAARAIELDVCGVDLMTRDISDETAISVIIEVNAAPGIRMHHFPALGKPRDAGEAIVEALFPSGTSNHVPLVSVTGTNGKTTTTRLIKHILIETGKKVGMTTTDGVFIGSEKIWSGDASGPQSARMVLSDPTIDAAVLETARGGILREGLGYDLADVAVITNITSDHIGQDGLETIEDIVHIKSLVAECVRDDGVVILNADNDELVKLSERIKHRIIWVSMRPDHPVVISHMGNGGQAFFVRNGWIMEGAGSLVWQMVKIYDVPLTLQGSAEFHVENLLCALAGARFLGVSRSVCKSAVLSFQPFLHNPGRVQMFQMPSGLKVVLDYGHNEDGMRAIGEMVKKWGYGTVPAVIGYPGDRNDALIQRAGCMAAQYFSPLIIKEDDDLRGRRPGEVAGIILQSVQRELPDVSVDLILNEKDALDYALNQYASQDVIVVFFEKLTPLIRILEAQGGREISLNQAAQVTIQAR